MATALVCQDCNLEPAVYGDGITTARCSACQYKHQRENKIEPEEQVSEISGGIPHQTVPGLTSIIIPVYMTNYSLFHYTGNCIGSIREHTDQEKTPYEIIIVDNGSPIYPPNLDAYYAHKVIQNTENLGVTKAWNQGIRAAFGEYIVLLNNDTQVYEGWLESLYQELETSDKDLVMAHPMYSLTEPFARAVESKRGGFDHLDRDFSCVMFKKELFEKLGDDYLFDERLFNYCSDIDLLDRMDKNKLFYGVVPVYIHHVSDATGYSMENTPEIMNKDKEEYKLIKMEEIRSHSEHLGRVPTTATEADILHNHFPEEENPLAQGARFIRCEVTGDRVFYVDSKSYRHWIKDPETLYALGGSFEKIETITPDTLTLTPLGEDISLDNIQDYA